MSPLAGDHSSHWLPCTAAKSTVTCSILRRVVGTYRSTFVIYDKETESIWYHLQGTDGMTCIAGHYADKKAGELPSVFTRWNQWRAEEPATKFLK